MTILTQNRDFDPLGVDFGSIFDPPFLRSPSGVCGPPLRTSKCHPGTPQNCRYIKAYITCTQHAPTRPGPSRGHGDILRVQNWVKNGQNWLILAKIGQNFQKLTKFSKNRVNFTVFSGNFTSPNRFSHVRNMFVTIYALLWPIRIPVCSELFRTCQEPDRFFSGSVQNFFHSFFCRFSTPDFSSKKSDLMRPDPDILI